jgi:hypothetical protein
MLGDPMTGLGTWPQPLLGVGLERIGHTTSHGPKLRLSQTSKIFLAVVVAQSIFVITVFLDSRRFLFAGFICMVLNVWIDSVLAPFHRYYLEAACHCKSWIAQFGTKQLVFHLLFG